MKKLIIFYLSPYIFFLISSFINIIIYFILTVFFILFYCSSGSYRLGENILAALQVL
jgi:hypothetical protein